MDDVVVDASALLAVAYAEESAEAVVRRLADARCHSTALLQWELANVTVLRCRKVPADAPRFLEALAHMLRLPIVLHDVDPLEVVTVAGEHKLTAYDAGYLWLARALRCPLVTLDRALADAARTTKPWR